MIRRWQHQESQRAIARATGLARVTVHRYLAHVEQLGLSPTGPPPTDEQLIGVLSLRELFTAPAGRAIKDIMITNIVSVAPETLLPPSASLLKNPPTSGMSLGIFVLTTVAQ